MIFIYILAGIAVLMGIVGPLMLFGGYGFLKSRRDEWAVVILIWLIGVGSVLAIALASRDWNMVGMQSGFSQLTGAGIWATRLVNVTAGALAFIELCRRLAKGDYKDSPTRGQTMAIALVLFVSAWLISSVVGTKPDFKHGAIYPLLALAAVYVQPTLDLRIILNHVKALVLAILVLSVAAAVVTPDAVVQKNYAGFIPGLSFRFHGLTTHANSLGPLALVYLLVEYLQPSRLVVRLVGVPLAFGTLIAAQSKTAWIAAMMAGLVLYLYRLDSEGRQPTTAARGSFALWSGVVVLIIVPVAASVVLLTADPVGALERFISPRADELTSFTGRNRIWQITYDTWMENPLFGYGPGLWDPEFRMSLGLSNIGHAHNQFMQSLGDSGILGVTFLVIFLLSLVYFAFRHGVATRGVSVALVLTLLVRCLTEAPIRPTTFLEPGFLTYFLVFLLLTQYERRRERVSPLIGLPA